MTSNACSMYQEFPDGLGSMSAASLYVGDLLPHITEVTLYKKFAPLGTVTSVKLCRDWVTGRSLCYAYVNFENPAEAEKAYRTLNYELLEGQPMRLVKSTRNPWLNHSKSGDGCCHHHCCGGPTKATGLVDAKTLVEAIESYSMAFKQTLAMQDSNEPKGPTGYKYSSDFLKRMNNSNKQYTNVFIKNFKDLLDDYKLWKLCKQFGEIVSAKVMVDEYGISRGFGFACFTDSDAAQREWRPTTVSSRICINILCFEGGQVGKRVPISDHTVSAPDKGDDGVNVASDENKKKDPAIPSFCLDANI